MSLSIPQNKSRRLADWNYSRNGAYFITFCTAKRAPILGHIKAFADELGARSVFVPSNLGTACLKAITQPNKDSDLFVVDSFVVMPNHVHLLMFVDQGRGESEDKRVQLVQRVVGRIKGHVSRVARNELGMKRVWQVSFHDHVVRSEAELERIREYIANNPLKWSLDRFYQI